MKTKIMNRIPLITFLRLKNIMNSIILVREIVPKKIIILTKILWKSKWRRTRTNIPITLENKIKSIKLFLLTLRRVEIINGYLKTLKFRNLKIEPKFTTTKFLSNNKTLHKYLTLQMLGKKKQKTTINIGKEKGKTDIMGKTNNLRTITKQTKVNRRFYHRITFLNLTNLYKNNTKMIQRVNRANGINWNLTS